MLYSSQSTCWAVPAGVAFVVVTNNRVVDITLALDPALNLSQHAHVHSNKPLTIQNLKSANIQ